MTETILIAREVKLEDAIVDYVNNHGFPHLHASGENSIVFGTFDRDLYDMVLEFGTDRDLASTFQCPQDKQAVKDLGIPIRNVVYTTVARLLPETQHPNKLTAAYDPAKIRHVKGATSYLYTAREPFTLKGALIGIFLQK